MPLKLACPSGCPKWIGAGPAAALPKPIHRIVFPAVQGNPTSGIGSMAGLACRNGWPAASAWCLSLLALWLLVRLGQRLLGADAGWWGGLLFAVLPLSVFYGRSIQPESLLLACSALALERGLACWPPTAPLFTTAACDLAFASGGLSGAGVDQGAASPLAGLAAALAGLAALWASVAAAAGAVAGGCSRLGAHRCLVLACPSTVSANGIELWLLGAGANRYSWGELIGPSYWGNLLLRTSVRGPTVLGLPLLVIGLLKQHQGRGTAAADRLGLGARSRAPLSAAASGTSARAPVHINCRCCCLDCLPADGAGLGSSLAATAIKTPCLLDAWACKPKASWWLEYWAKEQPEGNFSFTTLMGCSFISVSGGMIQPALWLAGH